jgi:hypothetical protein
MQRSKAACGYFARGRFGSKDGKEITDEIVVDAMSNIRRTA